MPSPASPTPRDGDRSFSGRLLGYAGGSIFVLLLGAWAIWMALSQTPEVASQLLRSEVHSDRDVTVHIEVAKTQNVPATCKIVALGLEGGPVGSATVTVPADAERVRLSHRVETTAPPASAQVTDCWLARSG